jgi:hypothetical protein
MQVSKLIEDLKELDPSDEIVIMYWAKDLFDDDFDEDNPILKDLWNKTVETVEGNNDLDNPSSEVYDAIYDQLAKGQGQ